VLCAQQTASEVSNNRLAALYIALTQQHGFPTGLAYQSKKFES
jgi:hypothetical protein